MTEGLGKNELFPAYFVYFPLMDLFLNHHKNDSEIPKPQLKFTKHR